MTQKFYKKLVARALSYFHQRSASAKKGRGILLSAAMTVGLTAGVNHQLMSRGVNQLSRESSQLFGPTDHRYPVAEGGPR